ncbi:hypothetical protein [Streptomyces sp. NPDC058548]
MKDADPRSRFTRKAADDALLGFTGANLAEQVQAISSGAPYERRVHVTG